MQKGEGKIFQIPGVKDSAVVIEIRIDYPGSLLNDVYVFAQSESLKLSSGSYPGPRLTYDGQQFLARGNGGADWFIGFTAAKELTLTFSVQPFNVTTIALNENYVAHAASAPIHIYNLPAPTSDKVRLHLQLATNDSTPRFTTPRWQYATTQGQLSGFFLFFNGLTKHQIVSASQYESTNWWVFLNSTAAFKNESMQFSLQYFAPEPMQYNTNFSMNLTQMRDEMIWHTFLFEPPAGERNATGLIEMTIHNTTANADFGFLNMQRVAIGNGEVISSKSPKFLSLGDEIQGPGTYYYCDSGSGQSDDNTWLLSFYYSTVFFGTYSPGVTLSVRYIPTFVLPPLAVPQQDDNGIVLATVQGTIPSLAPNEGMLVRTYLVNTTDYGGIVRCNVQESWNRTRLITNVNYLPNAPSESPIFGGENLNYSIATVDGNKMTNGGTVFTVDGQQVMWIYIKSFDPNATLTDLVVTAQLQVYSSTNLKVNDTHSLVMPDISDVLEPFPPLVLAHIAPAVGNLAVAFDFLGGGNSASLEYYARSGSMSLYRSLDSTTELVPLSADFKMTDGQMHVASDADSLTDWWIVVYYNASEADAVMDAAVAAAEAGIAPPPPANVAFRVRNIAVPNFCHPVLLCNGHGSCYSAYDDAGVCSCISGFAYGYGGKFCQHTARFALWWSGVLFIISVWILPLVIIYIWDWQLRKWRAKHEAEHLGKYQHLTAGLNIQDPIITPENVKEEEVNKEEEEEEEEEENNNFFQDVKVEARAPLLSGETQLVPEHDVKITLKGITAHGRGHKLLLDNIHASFVPGQLTAIMGPSGAGKSTLLKVLAGKMTPTSGKVLINDVADDMSYYRKLIGFVPQEDIMLEELTVKENLEFAAAMRLPRSWKGKKRKGLVATILSMLKLAHIRHNKIGSAGSREACSGGERKRVSVGIELAALPSVVFLDEPTSGLDSTTALELVSYLKTIASAGFTVIAVIHQPSPQVFAQFNNVMLLDKGKLRYFGSPLKANGYLPPNLQKIPAWTNPADYFLENVKQFVWTVEDNLHETMCVVGAGGGGGGGSDDEEDITESEPEDAAIQKETGAVSLHRYKARHRVSKTQQRRAMNRKTPFFFVQWFWFYYRALLQQKRDLQGYYMNNVLVVIAALLLGMSFNNTEYVGPETEVRIEQCPEFIVGQCELPVDDSYVTQWMLTSLAIGITAMASTLGVFGNERLVFWREAATGMSETAYFLGKNFADVINIFIPPGVYTLIYFALTNPVIPLIEMYIIVTAMEFVGIGMAYLVSILVKPSNSLMAGMVWVLSSVILSGFHPTLFKLQHNFGGYWARAVGTWWSAPRWGMEALYVGEVKQYDSIYQIENGLEVWSYKLDSYWRNFGYLIALGIVYRLLALLALKLVNRSARGKMGIFTRIRHTLADALPSAVASALQPLIGVQHSLAKKDV